MRHGDGAGLPPGLGAGHRVAGLGGDAEELLQVLEGDQPPPADLDVGQVAAAHLVVQQVAGQAGQAGGLIDGVGQPTAVRVLAGRRRPRWCRRRAAPDLRRAGARRLVQVPGRGADEAGRSLSRLGAGPLTFPVVLVIGAAGPGGPVDRAGSGQAGFGGPFSMNGQSRCCSSRSRSPALAGEDHGG